MKTHHTLLGMFIASIIGFGFAAQVHADATSQAIPLSPGWNIVSTPRVLTSHTFSTAETSENFDIYVLDASQTTGWATMADLGQTEFVPLYGYFIHNKTETDQTLTFNFATDISPHEKLFERTFSTEGWYSIGVANAEYAKLVNDSRVDQDNPSKILSLLTGDYDLMIDFTDAVYLADRTSVALTDPWKAAVPADVDTLNDLRNTKGYAIYIKEPGAKYNGFQTDNATSTAPVVEEMSVTTSPEDPDASIVAVEGDTVSDWTTVFAFNLNPGNSTVDLIVDGGAVEVQTGTANYNAVVNDARLVVDGITYDTEVVTNGDTSSATLLFDFNPAVLVEVGTNEPVELQLQFNALSGNYEEGETISASTEGAEWEAEGEDDILVEGAVTGETHTLRTAGIIIELQGVSETFLENDDATTTDNEGEFTIEFEVTAFESDVWIVQSSMLGTTETSAGVTYQIEGSSGESAAVESYSSVLVSSADEANGKFRIDEGETETFTLVVVVDPVTSGFVRAQLYGVNFSRTENGTPIQQRALPEDDFETDPFSI